MRVRNPSGAPEALLGDPSLRIVTYNCCAVPLLTGKVGERLRLAAHDISALAPSVVLFQEVYFERQHRTIERALGLPYGFRARRFGVALKGGLSAFSRTPIAESRFVPFRDQGPRWGYAMPGRLCLRGFMYLRLGHPPLHVVNTHPIADFYHDVFELKNGEQSPFPRYQASQLAQVAEFVRRLSADVPLVVCGDLNITPGSLIFRRFVADLHLRDAMAGSPCPSVMTGTFWGIRHAEAPDKRLDYVLVRDGSSRPASVEARLALAESRMIGGTRATLSDHFAVVADLDLG
jgi:Endonuclease/Exonuclease/phosphatase family